ncbi:MAG: hypothetical protein QG673_1931 [Pseudomonadota bacterium]|nr:hypothetical protein [Pseudomonadota bacterium]
MQPMLRPFSNAATRVSGNLNNTIQHNSILKNTSNGTTPYFHYNQTCANIRSTHNHTLNCMEATPSQKQFNRGNPILVRSLRNVPRSESLIKSNKCQSNKLEEAGGKTLFILARSVIPEGQHSNQSPLALDKLHSSELEFIYRKTNSNFIKELIKRKAYGELTFNIDPHRTEIKQVIHKVKLAIRMHFDTTFNSSSSLISNFNTKLYYSDKHQPIAFILDPKKIIIYSAFVHSVATHNRLYLPEYVDGKTKVWHDIIEDYVDYVDINHDISEPELLLSDLQRNIQQILRNKFLTNSAQYGNVEDNFLKNQLQDNVNEILFLPKNPESLDYICEIAIDLSMQEGAIKGDIERYLHQSEQIHLIEKIKTQFPDTPLSVIYTDSGNSSSKLVLKGIHQ